MIAAGLARAAALARFVSMTVMVGFIGAVGVSIDLGQLGPFTGFDSDRSGRVPRALHTVLHVGAFDWPTVWSAWSRPRSSPPSSRPGSARSGGRGRPRRVRGGRRAQRDLAAGAAGA
ncbi:MAG: SulP family inorganic anion transporter [Dermatophilaceae bacterium]